MFRHHVVLLYSHLLMIFATNTFVFVVVVGIVITLVNIQLPRHDPYIPTQALFCLTCYAVQMGQSGLRRGSKRTRLEL